MNRCVVVLSYFHFECSCIGVHSIRSFMILPGQTTVRLLAYLMHIVHFIVDFVVRCAFRAFINS